MNLRFIDDYINDKLSTNEEFIRITFYELRVKSNLTEEETGNFLLLAKTRLENMKYKVYFTKDSYVYNNINKVVQDNELMIAIKNIDK